MRQKILSVSITSVFLIISNSGYAQFGNLMNQFKDAAEKIQKEVQQQIQSTIEPVNTSNQQSQAVAPAANIPQPSVSNVVRSPVKNSDQSDSSDISKAFRGIWCKTIDTSSSGPFDFKGVKPGDLCQSSDDVIVAIAAKLKKSNQTFEWMTKPKALNEGGVLVVDNVIAGDKAFFKIAILIDPYLEKAYLASFTGLICAADPSNSLNSENPFRNALESKYGKPASAYTEYDSLKAQIDELEQQNSAARRQAITVREAKNTRDVDNMLPMLKGMLGASDKNAILSLTWDYEKGNPERPVGTATVTQARWNLIREVGGCKVQYIDKASSGSPSLDYGFGLSLMGTKRIVSLENSIIAKNQAKEKEKIQSAPAPKF